MVNYCSGVIDHPELPFFPEDSPAPALKGVGSVVTFTFPILVSFVQYSPAYNPNRSL
jgi:hypothetical protein